MVYQNFCIAPLNTVGGAEFTQHHFAHAARFLADGAIGVGEDHTVRGGRDFTIGLIRRGLVRDLFLEGISTRQAELNEAVRQWRDSGSGQGRVETIVEEAGPRYFYPGVPTLGEVAMIALRYKADIHLIDKKVGNALNKGVVPARDIHAAKLFNRVAGGTSRAGCLLLYGAAHFTRGDIRDTWYPKDNDLCLGQLLGLTSFIVGAPISAIPFVGRRHADRCVVR